MDVTIISESSDGGLHPVTSQLIGASSKFGGVSQFYAPEELALLRLHPKWESVELSLWLGIASKTTIVKHGRRSSLR